MHLSAMTPCDNDKVFLWNWCRCTYAGNKFCLWKHLGVGGCYISYQGTLATVYHARAHLVEENLNSKVPLTHKSNQIKSKYAFSQLLSFEQTTEW